MSDSNSTEANWYVVHTYSGYENKVKARPPTTVYFLPILDAIIPPIAKPITLPTPPNIVNKAVPVEDD